MSKSNHNPSPHGIGPLAHVRWKCEPWTRGVPRTTSVAWHTCTLNQIKYESKKLQMRMDFNKIITKIPLNNGISWLGAHTPFWTFGFGKRSEYHYQKKQKSQIWCNQKLCLETSWSTFLTNLRILRCLWLCSQCYFRYSHRHSGGSSSRQCWSQILNVKNLNWHQREITNAWTSMQRECMKWKCVALGKSREILDEQLRARVWLLPSMGIFGIEQAWILTDVERFVLYQWSNKSIGWSAQEVTCLSWCIENKIW